MGLTPERVSRVLDKWDEITAPGQGGVFDFQFLVCASMTVLFLIVGAWWLSVLFLGITFIFFRLAWERPNSRVRRLSVTITRAKR
jgi:hypothetical protein